MNRLKVWFKDLLEVPRWHHLLFIFIISIFIIILRRPDMILYPQLWAEDGIHWVGEAWNVGLSSLFIPVAGYFQTISRLAGLLTVLFPLAWAPSILNVLVLGLRGLVVVFLFSRRFSNVLPNVWAKVLLAALYLFLPDAGEVLANITNAHSHLALLCFMVLISPAPKKGLELVFDIGVYTLTCLSGAYIVLLYPVMALLIWREGYGLGRSLKEMILTALPAIKRFAFPLVLGLVQVGSFLFSTGRSTAELGTTIPLFVEIVVKRIILGLLFGVEWAWIIYTRAVLDSWPHYLFVVGLVLGSGALVYFGLRALSFEGRLFILFCGLAFVAALYSPMASFTEPQWPILAASSASMRYWFFPMLGFGLLIFASLRSLLRGVRWIAGLYCAFLFIGMIVSYRLPNWENLNYAEQVRVYESGGPDIYKIDILPRGWQMWIEKK